MPYQSVEVAFSFVDQIMETVVLAMLVADRLLTTGATVSDVAVSSSSSSSSNFVSIPFGSVWHSGTIGRTPSRFLSQPGAIKCPGGTIAHSRLFSLPWLSLSSSSSSSLSSPRSKAIKLSLRSLFNNCRVLGPTRPTCSRSFSFWKRFSARSVAFPK